MTSVVTIVYLTEFQERVYKALPMEPATIPLHQLVRRIYPKYEAKKEKGRRSHCVKAHHALWKQKLAGHTARRTVFGWSQTQYFKKRPVGKLIIRRKKRARTKGMY